MTRILSRIEQGDSHAAEALLPLIYDELRELAQAKMARESPQHTLEATALVHEASLRLVDKPTSCFACRAMGRAARRNATALSSCGS